MKIILLGAPGSGKGTQAEALSSALGIPAISTGNILREAIKAGTSLGQNAREYTDTGRLVPDDVIIAIIGERLTESDCADGFILDGFPRTIAQAEVLDASGALIDAVVSFEVADDLIERRMTGRRVCSSCGASFHTQYRPPESEGICDSCEGELVQRDDDAPETVRERLAVYHHNTEPVKGYYESKGMLRTVVAHDGIEAITKRTFDALGIGI